MPVFNSSLVHMGFVVSPLHCNETGFLKVLQFSHQYDSINVPYSVYSSITDSIQSWQLLNKALIFLLIRHVSTPHCKLMAQTHIKNKCCEAQCIRSCHCFHPQNGAWKMNYLLKSWKKSKRRVLLNVILYHQNLTEACAQNTYPILALRVTIQWRTTWPVIVVVVGFKAPAGSVAPGLTPITYICPLFPLALSTLISYDLKVMI
jgi:hypothetical protein